MLRNRQSENDQPRFPVDHAFLVQFQRQPAEAEARSGRVEHLASGRTGRFRDGHQLMEFVTTILAGMVVAADAEARPADADEPGEQGDK